MSKKAIAGFGWVEVVHCQKSDRFLPNRRGESEREFIDRSTPNGDLTNVFIPWVSSRQSLTVTVTKSYIR